MDTLWPLLALAFSFCGALIIGFNQWARVDGRTLVVMRVAGIWPLAACAALVVPFPTSVTFYAIAAAMGVGLAYADTLLFNASRTYGARLAALYVPLKMLIAFALWVLIEPFSVWPVLMEPWKLALMVFGFSCCGGALLFIRRSDASWLALIAVLPVAMLFALGDIVAKATLGTPTATHGLWVVMGHAVAFLLTTGTVGAVAGLMAGGRVTPTRHDVVKSAAFGALLLASLTLLLVTLALAPNPGYVAAITMLSAFWLAIWARIVRRERNSLWAGLSLLAGAMAVAIAGH